jgi:hypothetical protein
MALTMAHHTGRTASVGRPRRGRHDARRRPRSVRYVPTSDGPLRSTRPGAIAGHVYMTSASRPD